MRKKNLNDEIPPTVKITPEQTSDLNNYSDDYIPPTVKINKNDVADMGFSPGSDVPPTVKMPGAISNDPQDFKTIKISMESPKTLRFIPGYLEINDGEDKGKRFKISGYPTSEGNVISIGREEIKGERKYCHIQLLERTVSRKQAEIIEKKGVLYIKNYSEINPTKLNDKEIPGGAARKIKPGDKIRTGEVEFIYKIDE